MPLQTTISSPCVRDVMSTPPVTIDALATARQLARVLTDHDISGVPVTNGGGHVIGVVSRTDLLQWCVKGGLGFGASNLLITLADGGRGTSLQAEDLGIVADFMSSNPLTAGPDETLAQVAHRMAEHRVHRLVVLDDQDQLLGVITSLDLLKAFPE